MVPPTGWWVIRWAHRPPGGTMKQTKQAWRSGRGKCPASEGSAGQLRRGARGRLHNGREAPPPPAVLI
eukprot:3317183-Pyramimonas_sp.AAC.1